MIGRAALVLGFVLVAGPAAADESATAPPIVPFVERDQSVTWTSAGLIDEFRIGMQYERALTVPAREATRWRGVRVSGVVGAGFSSIGAGHNAMPMVESADGVAGWIAARFEYGGGGVIDGISGEGGFSVSIGPVVHVVDGIRRVGMAYRPGIVSRFGRFRMTFGLVLEHAVYAQSDRPDLTPDGWHAVFKPGFEVGLGVAF